MKRYFFSIAFLLVVLSFQNLANNVIEEGKDSCLTSEIDQQVVYVCTGNYAYAFHSISNCPGLNNCKGQIVYTDYYNAINNFDRVPCCRCWANASDRCHDDNPSYGAGGGGAMDDDALAIVAISIITLSAIILSNDIYLYPTYSFTNNISGLYGQYEYGMGLAFGFRKTFKHSALEYGATYMRYGDELSFENYKREEWGGNFNFIHQLFYNSTPYWLKMYIGPTVNYMFNDFGYGGIAGSELRIFDRLKFDIRYEYTTQTNHIQAGFIFTYQKKYFWNK